MDFIPIEGKKKRKLTAEELFEETLAQEEQKALKTVNKDGLRLPFAAKVARDDFKDYYDLEVKKNIRKNGYLEASEIKPYKMDWTKYSDLKNFEIIDEGETQDEYLTKVNPGLYVQSRFIKYKYNGYSNTYTVMEDGPSALKRAKEVANPTVAPVQTTK